MDEYNNENIGSNPEQNEELKDDLILDALKTSRMPVSKKKKSGGKKVFKVLVCLFLVFAVFFGGFSLLDMNGIFNKGVSVTIEKGSSFTDIANSLQESGAIKNDFLFMVYCKLNGYGNNFKYGQYKIEKGTGYKEIARILTEEVPKLASVRVTIPEGTGIYDYVKNVNGNDVTVPGIATLLEKAGVCSKEDFYEAVKNATLTGEVLENSNKEKVYLAAEGYLFPDTYDFYCYDSKKCAALAVEKMLSTMKKRFTPKMVERANEINMSVNEVLTLASIIQMEAGNAGEALPKVAAVFYNRLNRGEKLGSSPTGFYGNAFKNDDGRYNTYKIKGFPPGPLCSVGIDAINAVLYPEKNFNYYYFVTDKNGNFYFHKTYQEQSNTIARLKRENNWIYEYYE